MRASVRRPRAGANRCIAGSRSPSRSQSTTTPVGKPRTRSSGHMKPQHEHLMRQANDQWRALNVSRGDRDRALEALHALEAASGTAGPGREPQWRAAVADGLEQLLAAIAEQQESY